MSFKAGGVSDILSHLYRSTNVLQAITHTSLGDQVDWPSGIALYLAAQAGDERVERFIADDAVLRAL